MSGRSLPQGSARRVRHRRPSPNSTAWSDVCRRLGFALGCMAVAGWPSPTSSAPRPSTTRQRVPMPPAPPPRSTQTPEDPRPLENLEPGALVSNFSSEVLYEDPVGQVMGGRFRHVATGFVIDLLEIESVPQAFLWVTSPPPSDQGEPHTCEHLLLGKGPKGQAHASREDMSLGSSSAFTMQLRTCYHFHTTAGNDVFFDLMESQLDALIHPNFSDEEIRREVCHLGIRDDHGTLSLEEKGTVYNEMVGSMARPGSLIQQRMSTLLHGPGHPLALVSGGVPEAIRSMTPGDLRQFHLDAYHLSNMGMVLSIPASLPWEEALFQVDQIFDRVQPVPPRRPDPTTLEKRLPKSSPAPSGEVETVRFPNENPDAAGVLVLAWPPIGESDPVETILIDLFLSTLAGGPGSNLHRRLLDSSLRTLDVGASGVYGWRPSGAGSSLLIGFQDIRRASTDPAVMRKIRAEIQNEIARIAGYPDESKELELFNARARAWLDSMERDLRELLNAPAGFGFRGTGPGWLLHLLQMQEIRGYRKSLTLAPQISAARQALSDPNNLWRELLSQWKLANVVPHCIAAQPSPELQREERDALEGRLETATQRLMTKFGVQDPQEALAHYRDEYAKATALIDSASATVAIPPFVDSPPLSLDEPLDHRTEPISGVPTTLSTIPSMMGATVGVGLRLDGVAPDDRVFVSVLPALLRKVGLRDPDGSVLPYDEVNEEIRREISELSIYPTTDLSSGRLEIMWRGSGTSPQEAKRALHWLERFLRYPHWHPDNLARIRDVVDNRARQLRATPRGAEENWVWQVENGYRGQTDPLYLATHNYMTRAHGAMRVRWIFREASPDVIAYIEELGATPGISEMGRAGLDLVLNQLLENPDSSPHAPSTPQIDRDFSADDQETLREAARDLRWALAELPEGSLEADWHQLCSRIARDLRQPPERALERLREMLVQLRNSATARSFVVASHPLQGALLPRLEQILEGLADLGPTPPRDRSRPRVLERIRGRGAADAPPRYLGLVNPNTSSGVFVHTAPVGGYGQLDRETLLDYLTSRLYGGGGAHSLFMRTWGAGLAYSNGMRGDPAHGRMIYYAERCPALTQTLRFVVDYLQSAPADPRLADYAIAQAFSHSRSASRYERRGEFMAADLADGRTPAAIAAFRNALLDLRDDLGRDGLYTELQARLEEVAGRVLPGLGPPDYPGASNMVIGNEASLAAYEEHLQSLDAQATLVRIYPRDFWILD